MCVWLETGCLGEGECGKNEVRAERCMCVA